MNKVHVAYKRFLYSIINQKLSAIPDLILEIGSGNGDSEQFIDKIIIRSDIVRLSANQHLVCDAVKIPLKPNSLNGAFCIDVIHHCPFPFEVLREISRCLKRKQSLIIIEPYASLFSWPIYKLFHFEYIGFKTEIKNNSALTSADPQDADNYIPTSMFRDELEFTKRKISTFDLEIVEIKHFDFLSFFLTGGLTKNRRLIPIFFYLLILKIEKLIPKQVSKYICSRQLIILRKT